MSSAVIASCLYHFLAYGEFGNIGVAAKIGLLVAAAFLMANTTRNDYTMNRYFKSSELRRRTFHVWNIVFICALALAFLTKTTNVFSRASIILFYFIGIASLIGWQTLLSHFVHVKADAGAISLRRVFLVGMEAEVEAFTARYQPGESGMRVVAAAILRGIDTLNEDLALAAASARMLRPDDVFILAPWSQTATIDGCINAFMQVPASIHLGSEKVLDRFFDARITKFGAVSSLNIVRKPLTPGSIALKRTVDVIGSACGLILLAPLLALVALTIKLDSAGPVFFLQRRYGFNQEPFRIVKFRSMTTLEEGRNIIQAKQNDPRVTRVGRLMRRFNIDELPQLLNVLHGDMSLVGPRPHAMAHDQRYEQTIAFYARRHNVKPGITGWAQVNGLRGDTTSDDKMRMRVEYDLEYIDNWAILLDLRILFLTIFSRKAYRNAA